MSPRPPPRGATTTTDTSNRPALACDMTAFTPEERERHASLWKQVRALAPEPQATASGVAFRLPARPDLARDLVELAALEQRCCPFLRIVVAFEPDGATLTLTLEGDDGVREFLAGDVLPR